MAQATDRSVKLVQQISRSLSIFVAVAILALLTYQVFSLYGMVTGTIEALLAGMFVVALLPTLYYTFLMVRSGF
ncbi:MAG: hypothetical protein IH933_03640 [Euryarchaeota archaeon]|jgi:membrane-associated HD superfamily phosphohydrolase|nr:hypothetical protein [Euryarchaeota archaeon]